MIANAEEFQDVVLEFESWLPSVTSAVQQFEPVASEPVEIKKQLTEAEVSHFCIGFLKRIEMTNLLSIWKAVFVCLFVCLAAVTDHFNKEVTNYFPIMTGLVFMYFSFCFKNELMLPSCYLNL